MGSIFSNVQNDLEGSNNIKREEICIGISLRTFTRK